MKSIFAIVVFALTINLSAQSRSDQPSVLYNQATEEIGKQNYESAIQLLSQALVLKPDYAEALFARGTSFLMLNDRIKACQDFKAAQENKHWQAAEYIEKFCSRINH